MSEKKSLFSLTWPIFIETFLYMLLGTVDVFMLGKYSDNAVGAVGTVNQVMSIAGIAFTVITSGTAIICAQYIGAGKSHKEKNRLIGAALQFNAITGIMMSVLMVVFAREFLKFMNIDDQLMSDGMDYMTVVGGFVFLQAIGGTFTAILRSYGKTKHCMIITFAMNVFNIGLNYVLIFGVGPIASMGTKGAAISTSISRAIAAFVLFVVAFRTVIKEFNISYVIKINKAEIKKILEIGLPSAGETISYNLACLVIAKMINSIGKEATIANGYISTITNYNYLFAVAIAQGTAIMIGWKIGAGEKEEAYKLCLDSFKKGFIVSMAITAVCAFMGKFILGFFTDNDAIIYLGVAIFMIDFVNEAGRCANLIIINSLRAAGDVKFPVFAGVFSMWGISVLLSYIFGIFLEFGFIGVWFAKGLDEVVRGVMMYFRWRGRRWQKYSEKIRA